MIYKKDQRLSTLVIQEIIADIDNGIYKVGDKLPSEHELIRRFNVSRTVIREVIANLRANNLIKTQQGKGAFVLPKPLIDSFQIKDLDVSVTDRLAHIIDIRIAIEAETALMAAKNRTETDLTRIKMTIEEMDKLINEGQVLFQVDSNFHYAIALASKNPHFLGLLQYIDSHLIHDRQIIPTKRKIQALKEHEQICHAIEKRDPDAARAAMRLHLSSSRERLTAKLNG